MDSTLAYVEQALQRFRTLKNPEQRQRAMESLRNALRSLRQLRRLLIPSIDLLQAVERERFDQRLAWSVRQWRMAVAARPAEAEGPGHTTGACGPG